jgi:hypothetical protein
MAMTLPAEVQPPDPSNAGAEGGAWRDGDLSPRAELAIHAIFLVAVALIAVNVIGYALKAADPLLRSDNWDWVHFIVQPFFGGHFDVADLFLKRDPYDHAQPLRRAILVLNSAWFDMDFRLEAVFAAVIAMVNVGLLWLITRGSWSGGARWTRIIGRLVFLALAAAYVSLNATIVFTWSLLTLNYTSHTFLLLAFLAGWQAYRRGTRGTLALFFVVALVANGVADDTATFASIALVMSALLAGWRQGALRRAAWTSATAIAALATYLVLYRLFAPPIMNTDAPGVASLISALLAHWSDAWKWVMIPLTASVTQRQHVDAWFGAKGETIVVPLIAAFLLIANAWFWLRAFRGRVNVVSFIAITLMLLFYGLVVGILVARVSVSSTDYLWAPRYALVYQWNVVALLLMVLAQLPRPGTESSQPEPRPKRYLAIAGLLAVVVLLFQVKYSLEAWSTVRSLDRTYQQQATQMAELAANPDAVPENCVTLLIVCGDQPDRRAQDMAFLVDHELNLFSPQVQQRWGLTPDSQDSK